MKTKSPVGLIKKEGSHLHLIILWLERFFAFLSIYRTPFISNAIILFISLILVGKWHFSKFEHFFLDSFFKARPPIQTHSDIVFIEMAVDLLKEAPKLPLPFRYHATLVHILDEWEAHAIVFDLLFSKGTEAFDDQVFQEALQQSGRVYLPVFVEHEGGKPTWLHSTPQLEKAAHGIGHVNVEPDKDGTIRKIIPRLTYQNETHEHISLILTRDLLQTKMPSIEPYLFDSQGRKMLLINWAGKWTKTFTHYSYLDVLRSYEAVTRGQKPIIKPEQIKGKICLIGITLSGGADIKSTPLEPTYPGVGTIANVINSILTNQFIRPARRSENAIFLLLIGFTAILFFVPFRAAVSSVACALMIAFIIAISFSAFTLKGIWLVTFYPLATVLILFTYSTIYAKVAGDRERRKFFQLAIKDGLTGLYVIRHFHELMKKIIERAWKTNKPLSLMLIDTDQFKEINDTYSHLAGDEVLKHVAQTILSCIRGESEKREGDVAARYGGDEFIVAILNMNAQEVAFKIAERLRKSISEKTFEWQGKQISITISIGISTLRKTDKNIEELIRRADTALYRAKGQGRNQVCLE